MASDALKLVMRLEAETRQYRSELKKASGDLNTFKKDAGEKLNAIGGMFRTVVAAAAGSAFGVMIKGSIDSANRLNDLSTRLGTTVEGLSRLEYAAKLTGVSQNTLATGLQRMTRRIAEAATGSGEAVKALDELGLSAEQLKQLRPEEQFQVLADALEGVPNQADKVRLAMKLLDSEGVALLQTMEGGSAAIRALGQESDKTGNTISQKFATDATTANAALNKLGASSTGLANSMAGALAPTIESVADFIATATPKATTFAVDALDYLRRKLVEFAAKILDVIDKTASVMAKVSDFVGFDGVAESLRNVAAGYRETADALRDQSAAYSEAAYEKQKYEAPGAAGEVFSTSQFLGQGGGPVAPGALAGEIAPAGVDDPFATFLMQEDQFDSDLQMWADHYAAREQLSAAHWSQITSGTASALGNLGSLMNSQSRKMFEIGKAAAIAETVINTGRAAMGAYAALAPIPIVGPALAKVAATAAVVAGTVQVQNIKSQKFGGGGTVAGVSGGGGGAAPNTYVPPQPTQENNLDEQANGGGVTLVFNGDLNGFDVEQLAERLGNYINTSDTVFIDSSSRTGLQFAQAI